ncbi:MAG: hypothetical protein JO217_07510 [Acidobacteriaceae bacterium]|nr:hypothetical protein [Acidobacteriaceae bacterium]MBV9442527.1 hypothetical protein [Acidobacteriaceae bacterium]
MKLSWTIKAAVFAAATFCFAMSASSEPVSFDLPVQAHWGMSTLPPGHYTLEVDPATSWPQTISVIHEGQKRWVSPLVQQAQEDSNRSYLVLVPVGGTYFVREYNSGPTGKRYTFGVPKTAPKAQTASATTSVPVTRGY